MPCTKLVAPTCTRDHTHKPAAHRVVVLVDIPPNSDPIGASLDKVGVREALRELLRIALSMYQVAVLTMPGGAAESFCRLQATQLGGDAVAHLSIHPVDQFAEVVGHDAVLVVLGGGEAALAAHDEAARRSSMAGRIPGVILVPVASTGGAALVLWMRGYSSTVAAGSFAEALRDDLVYDAVFRDVLRESMCGFAIPN